MKLFLNAASPYARLVRVILVETGLQAQTELHYVDPWESPPDLLARNPAAKVPALDLDDGTQLIESGYIYPTFTGGREVGSSCTESRNWASANRYRRRARNSVDP